MISYLVRDRYVRDEQLGRLNCSLVIILNLFTIHLVIVLCVRLRDVLIDDIHNVDSSIGVGVNGCARLCY